MNKFIKLFLLVLTVVFSLTVTQGVYATDEDPTILSGGEIKGMSVEEVSTFYNISADTYAQKLSDLLGANVKSTDEIQLLHDNLGLEPSAANDIAQSLTANSIISPDQVVTEKIQEKAIEVADPTKNYFVWQIGLAILALYALTWILSKKGVVKPVLHKKLWNWILLISVIPAIFFGLMLAVKVTYGVGFDLPFSLTYWHVTGGIAMSIITILHIIYHTRYFIPAKKK
jgi:hypothetical protein